MTKQKLSVETHSTLICLQIPCSLLSPLVSAVTDQGISMDDLMTRLLEGLPGLMATELCGLKAPARQSLNDKLSIRVSNTGMRILEEYSAQSGLTLFAICRTLLYGILVSKEIKFIYDPNTRKDFLERNLN